MTRTSKPGVSEGMTEDEAREETARWDDAARLQRARDRLAVDIVATDNQRLDDTQEQTPETIWLHENCWRFGFILRYPRRGGRDRHRL